MHTNSIFIFCTEIRATPARRRGKAATVRSAETRATGLPCSDGPIHACTYQPNSAAMQHWTHLQNRGQGTGAYQHAIPAANEPWPRKKHLQGLSGNHLGPSGRISSQLGRLARLLDTCRYGLEACVQYELRPYDGLSTRQTILLSV